MGQPWKFESSRPHQSKRPAFRGGLFCVLDAAEVYELIAIRVLTYVRISSVMPLKRMRICRDRRAKRHVDGRCWYERRWSVAPAGQDRSERSRFRLRAGRHCILIAFPAPKNLGSIFALWLSVRHPFSGRHSSSVFGGARAGASAPCSLCFRLVFFHRARRRVRVINGPVISLWPISDWSRPSISPSSPG